MINIATPSAAPDDIPSTKGPADRIAKASLHLKPTYRECGTSYSGSYGGGQSRLKYDGPDTAISLIKHMDKVRE
jgi:hypothetical protein